MVVALSQSGKSKVCASVLAFGPVPDSLASTVGYTGSLVAMGMLADAWTTGRPDPGWLSLGERIAEFRSGIAQLVADLTGALSGYSSVDVIGSGGYSGAAEAAALLLRETSTMPTATFTGRQYLHGPMEAWPGVGHLVIGRTDTALVAAPLAGRGHPVIVVSAVADPAWAQPNV